MAFAKPDGAAGAATAAVTWLPSRAECSHQAPARQNKPKKTSITLIEISRSDVYSDRAAARAGAAVAAGQNRGRGGCPKPSCVLIRLLPPGAAQRLPVR